MHFTTIGSIVIELVELELVAVVVIYPHTYKANSIFSLLIERHNVKYVHLH